MGSVLPSELAQGCCSAHAFELIAEAVICLMRLRKLVTSYNLESTWHLYEQAC